MKMINNLTDIFPGCVGTLIHTIKLLFQHNIYTVVVTPFIMSVYVTTTYKTTFNHPLLTKTDTDLKLHNTYLIRITFTNLEEVIEFQ